MNCPVDEVCYTNKLLWLTWVNYCFPLLKLLMSGTAFEQVIIQMMNIHDNIINSISSINMEYHCIKWHVNILHLSKNKTKTFLVTPRKCICHSVELLRIIKGFWNNLSSTDFWVCLCCLSLCQNVKKSDPSCLGDLPVNRKSSFSTTLLNLVRLQICLHSTVDASCLAPPSWSLSIYNIWMYLPAQRENDNLSTGE